MEMTMTADGEKKSKLGSLGESAETGSFPEKASGLSCAGCCLACVSPQW